MDKKKYFRKVEQHIANEQSGFMDSTERNSNIELLRIFMAIGVFVLHYNFNPAGGGG